MTYSRYRHIFLFLLLFTTTRSDATIDKLRCMWRSDPATTMVIGWNQRSGEHPMLYYGAMDQGIQPEAYALQQAPDRIVKSKGMSNHFVRLEHLMPNTIYYFIIADSEGCSQRYSFKTAPDNSYERLSIIAGGDSRNYRDARRNANKLVAILNPDCVMFGGDMTGGDTAKEWLEWFDDWRFTIRQDGRLVPIIVARGNHEYSNATLYELFDTPNDKLYYALSLGGDLLRIYTLNSLIASGGNQREWLEQDLQRSSNYHWRFAQYHYAIRPHTKAKKERNGQLNNWAKLFYNYGVKLVMESDAHVVKMTYPLRPSRETGSEDGFIRDDNNGTTYIGEGCWGAPLRRNNDDKIWTKASGSFNQFKLIFVDQDGIEVRTIKTDNADSVSDGNLNDRFSLPVGLDIWRPNGEPVLYLGKREAMFANNNIQNGLDEKKTMSLSASTVEWRQGNRYISWKTTNELGGDATFEVQRAINRGNFQTFALVSGRRNSFNKYNIEDKRVIKNGEEVSYRLKHTDKWGEAIFYSVKKVNESKLDWADYQLVKPNPETGLIKIKYNLKESGDVAISLVDRTKIELKKSFYKDQKSGNYLKSIDVSTLPEGSYLLVIKIGGKIVNHFRIDKKV